MIKILYLTLVLNFCHVSFAQDSDFIIDDYKIFIDQIAERLKSGENDAGVDLSDLHIGEIQRNGEQLIDYMIQYTTVSSLRTRLFFIKELAIIDKQNDSVISDPRIATILLDGMNDDSVSIRSSCSSHLLSANEDILKKIDKSEILNEPSLMFCPAKILLAGLIGDENTIQELKQLDDNSPTDQNNIRIKASLARLGDENSLQYYQNIIENNDDELKNKALDYVDYINNNNLFLRIANLYLDTDLNDIMDDLYKIRIHQQCGLILNAKMRGERYSDLIKSHDMKRLILPEKDDIKKWIDTLN